ncbi:PRTase ComF-like [Flexibacter flexilis DSM 6793]|uniref:PRTase ComF-like n=1 Tax=Flexibacter flexilis DSM 6793 TaxID=927664 RepID=A0A1I1LC23_9BACT|nr:phosphoribosyltransferase family protein [Flexibacter flexilis]SFC70072.1 PRTase ComF-like [Flexibacter flexilis DSM 6793]
MQAQRIILNDIQTIDNQFVCADERLFDSALYSRFKYGSGQAAAHYAAQMYEVLRDKLTQVSGQWLITASAYKYVPTASNAIADAIYALITNNLPAIKIEKIKIRRQRLFASDYGNLDEEQRKNLMRQTDLQIDEEQVKGRNLIVVDDICVTGSHERRIAEMLGKTQVAQVYFLYVGQCRPPVVPNVEHRLNHEWMKSVENLLYIIENEYFIINARVCKFLLSYPYLPDLQAFYAQLSLDWLLSFQANMCGDGYDQMPEYADNYQILSNVIQQKRCFTI